MVSKNQTENINLAEERSIATSEAIDLKGINDRDGDEALQAILLEHGHRAVIDEATNRRLYRHIDLWLMPIMGFTYFMQYIDKVGYLLIFCPFLWLANVMEDGFVIRQYHGNNTRCQSGRQ